MEAFRAIRRALGGIAVLAALAVISSGCSSTPTPAATASLAISDAWARPATVGSDSAAYLTIVNPGPADALLSVRCTIAGMTMLHETSTDASGMTGMSMVGVLAVPASATVRLQPGGLHVMIGGLDKTLSVGDEVELELVFQHAGTIVVPAAVRAG